MTMIRQEIRLTQEQLQKLKALKSLGNVTYLIRVAINNFIKEVESKSTSLSPKKDE